MKLKVVAIAVVSLALIFLLLWLKDPSYDEWRTPIDFYGKVVDENTNPVGGAQVQFVWTDLSSKGSSQAHTTSDPGGLFGLHGVRGKNLVVQVEKDGYYQYEPSGLSFTYAGENENFTPRLRSPILFSLKKKGVADALAYCKNNFHVERDGTPLAVDFLRCSKTSVAQGQLIVECWTDDAGKKSGERYDWRCRISVPGGGLLQTTNRLNFEAPEGGYQSFDIISVSKSMERWTVDEKRNYFGRNVNGQYFRLNFEIIAAGDHFFEIESFLNPTGSRNLEFDPNKVVQTNN